MKKFSLFAVLGAALLFAGYTFNGPVTVPAASLLTVTLQRFASATGVNFVRVPDNAAVALTVEDYENGSDLATYVTTDNAEAISLAKGFRMISYQAITATGSTTGTATAIASNAPVVGLTGVTNAGAILPAVTGASFVVGNITSSPTNTLKLYPPTGGQINLGGADTALSVTAGKSYMCVGAATSSLYFCAGN